MKGFLKISVIVLFVSVLFSIIHSCKKYSVPTLTTSDVSEINTTSAVSGGNITNNGGAEITSRGICWSTSKNPTVSSNKTTDGAGSGVFTSNLTGLASTITYYIRAYAVNSEGTAYGNELSFSTDCGGAFTVNHSTAEGAPINKSVTYGTVKTNLSGSMKCWITQNLGASNQAASVTDGTEAAAGWYWQFNRKQGYQYTTSRVPNTDWVPTISENSDWLEANDPCHNLLGTGWRIPTYTEWKQSDINDNWTNYNNVFNSVLKLHFAGVLIPGSGVISGLSGTRYVMYRSSTRFDDNDTYTMYFSATACEVHAYSKAYGGSIRCLKD